jgi:CRP-like cAMP-binding protein
MDNKGHQPGIVLSGIPFGNLLLPEELEEINLNSKYISYQKHETIFRQGTWTSHAMYIKSGMVKIYKEGRNKRSLVLKVGTAGEFLGLMSTFGSDMHQYSASSVYSSEIGYIDINVFRKIIKNNYEFAMHLMQTISADGLFLLEKLMGQSHKQLPGRIADVILYFSDKIFKQETFEFPLTRRELAELAGTTKESLIRTLSEYKNDKIIELDGSRVRINSMKIVRTLSDLG